MATDTDWPDCCVTTAGNMVHDDMAVALRACPRCGASIHRSRTPDDADEFRRRVRPDMPSPDFKESANNTKL